MDRVHGPPPATGRAGSAAHAITATTDVGAILVAPSP